MKIKIKIKITIIIADIGSDLSIYCITIVAEKDPE